MRGDDCGLQYVVLVRDVAYRLKKKLRVLNEGDERAQTENIVDGRVVHDAPAAVPDDDGDADCAD